MTDWELDPDFPFGTQGAKPKSILLSPVAPPHDFLIGGHRYLFKWAASDREHAQIWSEIIAYEIGKLVGVPVPPAFLAYDAQNRRIGVLIEFFYGHPGQIGADRFVHAIERLKGTGVQVDFRCGSLRDNIWLTRGHKVSYWKRWWAETLAFDALISNQDRHSENWGFLITTPTGEPVTYDLAPAFDNGSSLGWQVQDSDLERFLEPNRVTRFVTRGRHHCGWMSGDLESANHVKLCNKFLELYGEGSETMRRVIQLDDSQITELMDWAKSFDAEAEFSERRAEFVATLLRLKRESLAEAIGRM